MKKISYYFLFLLVFSIYAEKKKLPVISKAEQLKTVKGKQIIWKNDGAQMVYLPSNPDGAKNREPLYDEFGDKTGKFIGTRPGHKLAIQSVVVSPDNLTAASAGAEGTIHIWDLQSLTEITKTKKAIHKNEVEYAIRLTSYTQQNKSGVCQRPF